MCSPARMSVVGSKDTFSTQVFYFFHQLLNLFLFVLCWKYNTALLHWQRKIYMHKLYITNVYNILLFSSSLLKAVPPQVKHEYLTSEALRLHLLLTDLSFGFSVFLPVVSLLPCLIVVLWLDLKIAQFQFVSCIFKYFGKKDFISCGLTMSWQWCDFTARWKPKGQWIMPCQPHTGQVLFILHVFKSGKGEYQTGVFSHFERSHAKIPPPEVHKCFIITARAQGCQDQFCMCSPQAFGREKGFQLLAFNEKSARSLLAFLVGSVCEDIWTRKSIHRMTEGIRVL